MHGKDASPCGMQFGELKSETRTVQQHIVRSVGRRRDVSIISTRCQHVSFAGSTVVHSSAEWRAGSPCICGHSAQGTPFAHDRWPACHAPHRPTCSLTVLCSTNGRWPPSDAAVRQHVVASLQMLTPRSAAWHVKTQCKPLLWRSVVLTTCLAHVKICVDTYCWMR